MFSPLQKSNITYALSCYFLVTVNRNYTDSYGEESLFTLKQVPNFEYGESSNPTQQIQDSLYCMFFGLCFLLHRYVMLFLTGNFHRLSFLITGYETLRQWWCYSSRRILPLQTRKNNTSHVSLHQQKWFEDLFAHLTR